MSTKNSGAVQKPGTENKEVAMVDVVGKTIPAETLSKLKPADFFVEGSGVAVVGSNYERLVLEVGEVSPFLRYVRKSTLEVENERPEPVSGVMVKVKEFLPLPIAIDLEGKTWSLPIAQIFRNRWNESKVQKRELFVLKRLDNRVKQNGLGKGTEMENYLIAFPERKAEEDSTDAG
jgi:hypothetical protein